MPIEPFNFLRETPRVLTDKELAQVVRVDLQAEFEAIVLYEAHLFAISNSEAKKIYEHIVAEEKEHAGLFLHLLRRLDPEQEAQLQKAEGGYYEEIAKISSRYDLFMKREVTMAKEHTMKKLVDNLEAVAHYLEKHKEPKAAAKVARVALELMGETSAGAQEASSLEKKGANHAKKLKKILETHKSKMKMTPELAKDLAKLHEHMTKAGS